MLSRTLLFLIGLLWLGQAYAQQQPMSSAAADSSRRFDYISQTWLNNALQSSAFGPEARTRKMHSRFEGFWQNRYTTDVPEGRSIFDPIAIAMSHFFSPANSNSCLGGTTGGDWSYLGPKKNYYGMAGDTCGRVVSLWAEPGLPNHILAGSASGGLFQTWDGGQHWSNITDNSPDVIPGTTGVTHIAVHPADYDFIYLATGIYRSYPQVEHKKYGMGLVYTTNGGTTWAKDEWFDNKLGAAFDPVWEIHDAIPKLAYSPHSHKLYAIYRNRIYVRDGLNSAPVNGSWTDITPTAITSLPSGENGYHLTDFEFTESPQGSIIFSTNCVGATNYLFRYNETTQAWQSKAYSIPNFHNLLYPGSTDKVLSIYGVFEIALDPNDQVYLLGKLRRISDTLDKYFLYRYNWATDVLAAANVDIEYGGPRSPTCLAISKHNPNRLYLTDTKGYNGFISKSEDGGASFPLSIGDTHPDGRVLQLYTSTNSSGGIDDVLYCGTDGGVAFKPAGATNFHSISGEGLNIAEMYGVTSSPSHDGILVAGAVDNGIHSWTKQDVAMPWKTVHWGDGTLTAMARNGSLTAFSQSQGYFNDAVTYNPTSGATGTYYISNPQEYHQDKWWKPLQFDAQNVARVGWFFLWRRDLASSGPWLPSFGSMQTANEPKPVITTEDTDAMKVLKRGQKYLQDFIISDQEPNVGYIAYAKPNWLEEPDARYDDFYGKLFYSTQLGTSNPEWTNVTPPYVRGLYQINDIEIDPQHPRRLWVAYGGAQWDKLNENPALRDRRVQYHADYGDTTLSNWQNKSKGLPPMPINKLLYVEGSDDVLFAGTDVGVYRWNKALERWECFNNGIPRGMVTDLELNYCSGKLRATIFGRGIWETDYAADMASVVPGEVHTIAANTNWSSSKTVSGSIRVKSGATLTISGSATKIYMPRNGRILVEPGGALIVDGATLTNECGHLWKGIELGAQAGQPPVAALQGYCELRNQATVAYAKEGVWNFSPTYGYWGGGIIRAGNTTFYNCWRAVGLNEYPSYSYQYNGASQCSFDQCDFIIDDKALLPPGQMFSSWNTQSGVRIRDCQFRNEMPQNPQQLGNARGTAIQLGHTGIQVENTHFQGWSRGIYALGISRTPARTVKIYGNTFVDTRENVTMGAASYGDIKSNIFQYLPYGKGAYGVYLDNAAGSYVGCSNEIYGNYFGGALPRLGEIGVIANLTRNYATHVRNNYFYNLTIGAQTQLWNNNLHLQCNTHTGNAYPWLINPASEPYSFTDQGSSNDPAGNKFVSNMTGIRSYLNPNGWTYYAGSGANEIPSLQGNITLVSTGKTARCARPLDCYKSWGVTERNTALAEYSTLTANGQRYQEEGRLAYAGVIQAYNALGDMDGLETFLENENDNESNRLLVSLYTDQRKYTDAVNTLTALHLPAAEEDYYSLLIGLAQSGRRYDSLTVAEHQMVTNLAADEENEASAYARAYLEANYSIAWEHPIEEMPIDEISRKVQLPQSPDGQQSKLMAPAPNPVESAATIGAFISEKDYKNKSFLIVRDAAGAEVYRSAPLAKGDNRLSLDVRQWRPGVYLVGLLAGDDVLETRKLSVVR